MGSGRKGNRKLTESDTGLITAAGHAVVTCSFEATVPVASASEERGDGVIVHWDGAVALVDAGRVLAVLDPTNELTQRIAQCLTRDYTYRGVLRGDDNGLVVDVTPC